jgi:hypothetical protein
MIILNRDRFFGGGRLGVIATSSFRCAINTVFYKGKGSFAVISSFSGEWDYKNYEPVAEGFLRSKLSRGQVRQFHDSFVKQLDRCGSDGGDLNAAIEEVFGRAQIAGIVTKYENRAAMLLGGSGKLGRGDRI